MLWSCLHYPTHLRCVALVRWRLVVMLPEFLVEESWTIGHQILPPFSCCNSLPRFLVPVFDPFHVFDFWMAQLFFLCALFTPHVAKPFLPLCSGASTDKNPLLTGAGQTPSWLDGSPIQGVKEFESFGTGTWEMKGFFAIGRPTWSELTSGRVKRALSKESLSLARPM